MGQAGRPVLLEFQRRGELVESGLDSVVVSFGSDPDEEEEALGTGDGEQGIDFGAAKRGVLFQGCEQGPGIAGAGGLGGGGDGELGIFGFEFADEVFGGGAEISAGFLGWEDSGDGGGVAAGAAGVARGSDGGTAARVKRTTD